MLEGAQGDKVPSQIIFQMPKLGLMNVCSVLCGGGHRDGRETKAKEWLILNISTMKLEICNNKSI